MKIIQITPGVIPIPPNGWGAVEKVIWEYKLSLEKAGYPVEIKYCDRVQKEPGQIVHVHMANLAHLLYQRGIPYVFSLHDHHVESFGKDSDCYKTNYEAIKNSKLTFVHAKHLIEYFDSMSHIVYLPHGANLTDYKFIDRSERVRRRQHRLVMMANNGLGGNPLIDRKGFLPAIWVAKELNLPISIICPSKGNKEFFAHHNPHYEGLEIHYDLDYQGGLEKLSEGDIFIHPSNLEAGHPNLTLVEAVVSGLPVVGCLDRVDLPGMIKTSREVDDLKSGILEAIDRYDSLINACQNNRDFHSWDIIVTRMLNEIKVAFGITEKDQLMWNYQTTKISHKEKIEGRGYVSNFKSHKAFIKNSVFTEGGLNVFKDKKTGRVIYWSPTSKKPSSWSYCTPPVNQFNDMLIKVKQGNNILYSDSLELSGKRVLLEIHLPSDDIIKKAEEFSTLTGCYLTIKGKRFSNTEKICFDPTADSEDFYFTLNDVQLIDWFNPKPKLEEKILFELNTSALGDTLGFIGYAQEWASQRGKIVNVSINFTSLFDPNDYPNLIILDKKSSKTGDWTDVSQFDYFYDRPLQRGYSDQMGLEWKELRPKVKRVSGDRPIKGKYVCIGIHSTAQCKYWNYPGAWDELCRKLRKRGLTPVSLDMHEVFGIEGNWNKVPDSALKKLGMSLDDIILHLQHCEFFIGLSSGLSWLAWGVGKKVVMISGTTAPENEFLEGNLRISPKSGCHSCFNKVLNWKFNPGDWMWCPEGRDTDRWFECTKSISPDMVILEMERVGLIASTQKQVD